ncbi:HpcH/HpaI aldolase/citrate lyase family protein [Ramlibacter montanisoli]|uniref:CoA ester lyase n=1 Tax=Ramlibacter montanisoli TaxID=2732512 RepID=A0A849KEU4_9BURK|nr:CoA ester lyase [Ramlibacter montanisoli]NNU44747.1 CoA ester lyase [Ramlibacter montanisoli]
MTPLEPCSMLFVPADQERFLAKAGQRGADALILDLEDAVARPAKAGARANLASFTQRLKSAGVPIYIRVNNEPELLAGDLQAAVAAGCDGLLMPKVDTPEQVLQLDEALRKLEQEHGRIPGSIPVVALIESPLGICNVIAIAKASKRLSGLLFGVEDFGAAMGMESRPEGMTGPAQTMAIAAAAAGLQPLGLPGSVADFSNPDAYRALATHAKRIGMRGSVCIHPAQVPILNEVFGGSEEEAEHARRLLTAFDASVAAGKGAVAHEGRMIDEPIAVRARRFLQRHDALKARRNAARQQAAS